MGLTKCDEPLLGDLNAAEPYDGLELRTYCAHPEGGPPTIVESFGTSCAADSCREQVREFEASLSSTLAPGPIECAEHTYLLVMRDGELVRVADDLPELEAFLGSLDRPSDAALYARLAGIGCVGVRADAGHWRVVASEVVTGCQVRYQDVFYSLTRDGELTLVGRGAIHGTNNCVGRRPLGLVASAASAATGIGGFLAVSAELEAASVVAFEDAERSFRAHGAPAVLLARIRRARNDEVRHARAMTALARRYGAAPRPRRIQPHAVPSLEALARENVREGCVVETWGAAVGLLQARQARDPALRRVMQRISTDELRHAELSWDLQEWLDSRLVPESRRRVRSERDVARDTLARSLDVAVPAWAPLAGLPSQSQRRRLWAEVAPRLWETGAR